MKIGILGDTHGRVQRTQPAVEVLSQQRISAILHTGDIGSAEIVRLLDGWRCHFVGGNADEGLEALLAAAVGPRQVWHGAQGDFRIGGRRIALVHGHRRRVLEAAIASGEYDLVCYGHTHKVDERRVGPTLVINPGALFRTRRPTCAVVDLKTMNVEFLPVSSSDAAR